jgi:hypothetical protein
MRARIAIAVPGLLLMAYGAFRLLTNLEAGELLVLGVWLGVAVLVHDAVIAPVTVGTGVALTRLPARGRRYVQGGLIVAGMVTVVALPLIQRQGTQPEAEALLLQNYTANLVLLLGLVAAVAAGLYAVRVIRDRT